MTPRTTRAQRLAMPLARDVVRDLAVSNGGCLRPVQLRRTDTHTGEVDQVLVPCGHTLASVCPSCAKRAKALRADQCREGWHLDHEPTVQADEPDEVQRMWVERRAETQADRDHAQAAGQDTTELDAVNAELDEEITGSGVRGKVMPTTTTRPAEQRMPRPGRGYRDTNPAILKGSEMRYTPHDVPPPSTTGT